MPTTVGISGHRTSAGQGAMKTSDVARVTIARMLF